MQSARELAIAKGLPKPPPPTPLPRKAPPWLREWLSQHAIHGGLCFNAGVYVMNGLVHRRFLKPP